MCRSKYTTLDCAVCFHIPKLFGCFLLKSRLVKSRFKNYTNYIYTVIFYAGIPKGFSFLWPANAHIFLIQLMLQFINVRWHPHLKSSIWTNSPFRCFRLFFHSSPFLCGPLFHFHPIFIFKPKNFWLQWDLNCCTNYFIRS